MKKMRVSLSFVPLFSSSLLMCFAPALGVQAQAPAAGATVAVRMIDAVDSSKDPAGKQYRASVARAVDAGNGVAIPQGAPATVTLTNTGSGYTAQLVSVTVNGQPVAVSSGAANVTSAAQSAAGAAMSSVNSVLGGFGRHVNAPAAATAMATGQHVLLPPGVTLSFVLSQPPALNQAAPATPAAQPAPTSQPMVASAAPSPAPHPAAAPAAVAAPGQTWWMCQYRVLKDKSQHASGTIMYYSVFPSAQSVSGPWILNWLAYLKQNHYNTDASGGTSSDPHLGGACNVTQWDPAGRAAMIDMLLKQWAHDKADGIDTHWNGLPGSAEPEVASAAAPAGPAPAVAASGGGYFMSCSTSGGAGIDTYYTGVFPIKTAKRSPNGFWGSPESQPALDKFYAYLTQKGYTFKPGSSSGCDIGNTEAAAQAAQHKRAYEGGGCPTCGKIVETGWKP